MAACRLTVLLSNGSAMSLPGPGGDHEFRGLKPQLTLVYHPLVDFQPPRIAIAIAQRSSHVSKMACGVIGRERLAFIADKLSLKAIVGKKTPSQHYRQSLPLHRRNHPHLQALPYPCRHGPQRSPRLMSVGNHRLGPPSRHAQMVAP